MTTMNETEERAALSAEILRLAPGLAPLDGTTTPQLRELLAGMHAQIARRARMGLVDESAPQT
jgi:hypothetical protein